MEVERRLIVPKADNYRSPEVAPDFKFLVFQFQLVSHYHCHIICFDQKFTGQLSIIQFYNLSMPLSIAQLIFSQSGLVY